MMLAKIALSAATFAIDRPYSYRVPAQLENLLEPGMRVLVPFGKGNRSSEGLVLSLEQAEETHRLKEIQRASSWRFGCGSGLSVPSMPPR